MNEILLFALGVFVTIAVAYYFRPKEKLPKMLTAWSSSFPLVSIQDEISEEIQITYRQRPIDGITRIQVKIWNSGGEIIRGSEISSLDPLRINVDTSLIISKPLIEQSRPSVGANALIQEDRLLIIFDMLDLNDWASFEVLLDKVATVFDEVAVEGVIAGIPDGIKAFNEFEFLNRFYETQSRSKNFRKYLAEFVFFTGLTFFLAALAVMDTILPNVEWPARVAPAILGGICAAVNAVALYRESRALNGGARFRPPSFLAKEDNQ